MYKSVMKVVVFDQEVELYTIGKAAKIINKSAETIRAWERQKVIPAPLFRTGKVRLYHPEEVKTMKKVLKRLGNRAKKEKIQKAMWDELSPLRVEILDGLKGKKKSKAD